MIVRQIIRWTTGIDMVEALERATADRDAARADFKRACQARDGAIDRNLSLKAELETARKTATLHRSLIGILRDVNRDLDERNTFLEQLHGMKPGERLEAVEKDAPDRCTKTEPPAPRTQAAERLADWERHGSHRWGLGVAHDIHNLACRVTALERRP